MNQQESFCCIMSQARTTSLFLFIQLATLTTQIKQQIFYNNVKNGRKANWLINSTMKKMTLFTISFLTSLLLNCMPKKSQKYMATNVRKSQKKWGCRKHPHFLNFSLANKQGIVYNQYRNNQRIFALSDGCHRKLLNMVYELCRLSPIGVEDSHFIFCGGCQGTIKPRTRPTITSKLLTYSYVPPFLFPERQPPDYPHIVLIWL